MSVFAESAALVRSRACLTALACLLGGSLVAAQDPPTPPEPVPAWTGNAAVGLSLTSGNSDTLNFNAAFDVTHDPRTRNVMKWTGLYLRGKQEETLTVDRTSLAFSDQFALTQRAFAFAQVEYLRDAFKLIDYLAAPTVGLGYKILDSEQTKFAVKGGVGAVWEKNPGLEVRTDAALVAGETLVHQMTSTAVLKQAVTALLNANDVGDGLYTFSVGLATRITSRVQLSIDLLDTYKNRAPTEETERNDVALVTALVAKF